MFSLFPFCYYFWLPSRYTSERIKWGIKTYFNVKSSILRKTVTNKVGQSRVYKISKIYVKIGYKKLITYSKGLQQRSNKPFN